MSNQSPETRVHNDLARAVQSGLLPKQAHEQAEKLIARLEAPVRLALMGLPGSGKSSILNLLVAAPVMVEGVRLPTLELVYGAEETAICTLSDGTKEQLDGVDAAEISALSPAFVELHMPLPALKKISVLEVVAPADPNALHRASQWASRRCDVAIWCTEEFNSDEQRIWAQMSDTIKDHALLMITHRDKSELSGRFDSIRAAAQRLAVGEFNKILSIATPDAIAARKPDGSVDKDQLRQSGGMALISAVLKQVELGRRSAVDMGEVLLLQNEAALADIDAVLADGQEDVPIDTASPTDTAMPVEIAPEPQEDAGSEADGSPAETPAPEDEFAADEDLPPPPSSPAARDRNIPDDIPRHERPVMSPLRRPTQAKIPSGEAKETERVSVGIARLRDIAARRAEEQMNPPPPDELLPATREAYQKAVDYLQEHATEMSNKINDLGDDAPAVILKDTVAHMNWLCDHLAVSGDESDQALQRGRDTAYDAADLVQLMQMERRDSAAIEALSLMLQVKRELQADLAA